MNNQCTKVRLSSLQSSPLKMLQRKILKDNSFLIMFLVSQSENLKYHMWEKFEMVKIDEFGKSKTICQFLPTSYFYL